MQSSDKIHHVMSCPFVLATPARLLACHPHHLVGAPTPVHMDTRKGQCHSMPQKLVIARCSSGIRVGIARGASVHSPPSKKHVRAHRSVAKWRMTPRLARP